MRFQLGQKPLYRIPDLVPVQGLEQMVAGVMDNGLAGRFKVAVGADDDKLNVCYEASHISL